jgi:hypothetical protein
LAWESSTDKIHPSIDVRDFSVKVSNVHLPDGKFIKDSVSLTLLEDSATVFIFFHRSYDSVSKENRAENPAPGSRKQ